VVDLLLKNPLLLLFLVAAIGYPLGRIRILGVSLGVSAVLFVGLIIGSLDPGLQLPEIIYSFGQVLFIYTIGLASGSIFFTSLRQRGARDLVLVAGVIFLGALAAAVLVPVFHLKPTLAAGLFTGSLTNTPALAGVLEFLQGSLPASLRGAALTEPVVAYSLTYPVGIIGTILTVQFFQRRWKIDYAQEAHMLRSLGGANEPLANCTIQITHPEFTGIPVRELVVGNHWNILFGRHAHAGETGISTGSTRLAIGDLVNLVGAQEDLDGIIPLLGEPSPEHLEQDLTKFDKRRIFVSSPQAVGRRLRDLDLLDRFGAIITRIRRGDIELLPRGDTLLAPGDQVRVVAEYGQMDRLVHLFGDSYRAVSEIDILTFSLGLALGLLVGLVPIPLPGGLTLHLGSAGGPLIVSLVLGALGRTGPMVWTIPYSANLTLRQIGLVLFLAGVGTRAGYAFFHTLLQGSGLLLLALGALITCLVSATTLWIGYRVMKIPMSVLVGLLAGLQTQTSALSFAIEQTGNEIPNLGYATAYPVATLLKIILAQAIVILIKG
jgi:putative transport protein